MAHIRAAWDCRLMAPKERDTYLALPKTITVYRGQDASAPVGLSWTTNRSVAETFGRGHRGILNSQPVVFEGTVCKRHVAGVYSEREESEIVVFEPAEVEFTNGEQLGVRLRKR
jgi:hypothetical protein